MSESTPFSRQRLPAPTEPLADRVAAVLAECDAARVRERARRDRVAAIEARPVPPAVTPELRAARARVRETRRTYARTTNAGAALTRRGPPPCCAGPASDEFL